MLATEVRLTQTRPVDGKPNPYRTRWFEHDGVVFEISANYLNSPWTVWPDTDLLTANRARTDYINSSLHVLDIVMRLADARTVIAEWINSPEWPAIRDAYRALRADLVKS